jgi:hypothetical protein
MRVGRSKQSRRGLCSGPLASILEAPTAAGLFLRWYNAAMSKPFQFSMRVMFAGVASFCVGAWELSVVAKRRPAYLAAYVSYLAIMALLGAGLGAPAGKSQIAAVCGVAMSMALIAVLILLTPSQMWP